MRLGEKKVRVVGESGIGGYFRNIGAADCEREKRHERAEGWCERVRERETKRQTSEKRQAGKEARRQQINNITISPTPPYFNC